MLRAARTDLPGFAYAHVSGFPTRDLTG